MYNSGYLFRAAITFEFRHEPTNRRFAYVVGYLFASSHSSIMELVHKNMELVVV